MQANTDGRHPVIGPLGTTGTHLALVTGGGTAAAAQGSRESFLTGQALWFAGLGVTAARMRLWPEPFPEMAALLPRTRWSRSGRLCHLHLIAGGES